MRTCELHLSHLQPRTHARTATNNRRARTYALTASQPLAATNACTDSHRQVLRAHRRMSELHLRYLQTQTHVRADTNSRCAHIRAHAHCISVICSHKGMHVQRQTADARTYAHMQTASQALAATDACTRSHEQLTSAHTRMRKLHLRHLCRHNRMHAQPPTADARAYAHMQTASQALATTHAQPPMTNSSCVHIHAHPCAGINSSCTCIRACASCTSGTCIQQTHTHTVTKGTYTCIPHAQAKLR
jgi:hypothetical protein